MCCISYTKYLDEKSLLLGKHHRRPLRDSYPRRLHKNLEILIEETGQDKYKLQVLDQGEPILPYTLLSRPRDNPNNRRPYIINTNDKLSNGVFHLQTVRNLYFFGDRLNIGIIIEIIHFIKYQHQTINLFWIIESYIITWDK